MKCVFRKDGHLHPLADAFSSSRQDLLGELQTVGRVQVPTADPKVD